MKHIALAYYATAGKFPILGGRLLKEKSMSILFSNKKVSNP